MRSKKTWFVAILIGLLILTSFALADGINLKRVDKATVSRGESDILGIQVSNDYWKDLTVNVTMELSVPGLCTKRFKNVTKTVEAGEDATIRIPFKIEADWPTGTYNTCIYIEPGFTSVRCGQYVKVV